MYASMITYVPLLDYSACASVLDDKRLAIQRVDVAQVYHALQDPFNRWHKHPAVAMWQGCETGLLLYGLAVCEEWLNRGHLDPMLADFERLLSIHSTAELPQWWSDNAVHASHRAALLAKMPQHYKQFHWTEKPGVNLVWPR